MKIYITYPTGNRFEDGAAEIGRIEEHEVETRDELNAILPEEGDYFLTNEDGEEITAFGVYCQLPDCYYYLDTEYIYGCVAIPKFALYRGELDECGEKLRDTEKVLCWTAFEDIDIDPMNEDVTQEDWDKIDNFIRNEIGFVPEYEVN